ncbi:MAG: glycosyltransferase family 2 protein [Methylococcales symbiont of Hymedesmia sp. n. MRB-2018]|nr:MAG: glycosyltransferase family 2 protein [Methylococcales symbiont of Hymedesmia sp. n. MRB-2018]
MSNITPVKQTPLLSIIIPCYNYADTLTRAINSVLLQVADDVEFLVIDDGSTDNTATVVADILANHTQRAFRFIQHENKGLAATRNVGVDETKGEYLIFLDADDEMMPDALKHYRKAIKSGQSIGMVAGGHFSKKPSGQVKEHPLLDIPDTAEARLRGYLLNKSLTFSNSAVAIAREVFDGYRYPEQFRASEDISMFVFILVNFTVHVVNEPLAIMHRHDNSLRHNPVHAIEVGLSMVDEVFDPKRVPASLQGLKQKFITQRSLSLFRTLFLAGEYRKAQSFYHQAIQTNPEALFRMSYFIKYVRSWL